MVCTDNNVATGVGPALGGNNVCVLMAGRKVP